MNIDELFSKYTHPGLAQDICTKKKKKWEGGELLSLVIQLQFSMKNSIVIFHYACTNLDKLKSQLSNY